EVVTYSLTMPEKESPLVGLAEQKGPLAAGGEGKGGEGGYVTLKNPISSERVVMRQTLLAGVLEVAASNLRHVPGVRLFELGFVYRQESGPLPQEPRRLAIVLTGPRQSEFWADAQKSNVKDALDFF